MQDNERRDFIVGALIWGGGIGLAVSFWVFGAWLIF